MKTTVEIPDSLFRKAKLRAAERGVSLKRVVTEALREKLDQDHREGRRIDPPWMRGFGKLRRLRRETSRIQARIDDTFGVVEAEDRE